MQIQYTEDFKSAYKHLKKKYSSFEKDFLALQRSLVQNPDQGTPISLGLLKIRMAITSKSKGKSGGARVIIQVRKVQDNLLFLFVYDKNEIANVDDRYLKTLLKKLG